MDCQSKLILYTTGKLTLECITPPLTTEFVKIEVEINDNAGKVVYKPIGIKLTIPYLASKSGVSKLIKNLR
jgi:hypothetical protein